MTDAVPASRAHSRERSPSVPLWPGVIEAFRDRLPVTDATPVITLFAGGTPLVTARVLSERTV